MNSKINSEDQWKHFNKRCRDNPALAQRINSDPWIIGILAAMSGLLSAVPNAPQSMITSLTSAVPMPRALYFGTPCPFHELRSKTHQEAQQAYADFSEVMSPFRSRIADLAGIPGWIADAAFWLEDLDARISIAAFFEEPSNEHLCLSWRWLASSLRDRAWTLVRLERGIKPITTFRRHSADAFRHE